MTQLLSLLNNSGYINPPQGWFGWFIWLLLATAVAFFLRNCWGFNRLRNRNQWVWIILVTLSAPFANLFLGLQLNARDVLPPPGVPAEPIFPVLMIFSALPWVLAGGIWGPAAAALVGLAAGLARALWYTHDPFTPLLITGVAVLYSALVRQPYRTTFYNLARHPMIAAIPVGLLYPLATILVTPLVAREALVSRLDYAFNQIGLMTLAFWTEVFIASIVGEILARFLPTLWIRETGRLPSPAQLNLKTRFLNNLGLLAAILTLALITGNWYTAGNIARAQLQNQMATAAQMAAESVPYFLESGQSILEKMAEDPRLLTEDSANLVATLGRIIHAPPYFDQLTVLDADGKLVAVYPESVPYTNQVAPDEEFGIDLALSGVPYQTVTVPPAAASPPDETSTRVTFIAALFDENGAVQRVLLAQTNLEDNPYSRPILSSLNSTVSLGGEGLLLDEAGDSLSSANRVSVRILAHSDSTQTNTPYTGKIPEQAGFFEDTGPDGTRRLAWYQPAVGRPWSIVLIVPAAQVQQLALDIAMPTIVMISVLFLIAAGIILFSLNSITASLHNLTGEANRLSQGKLNHAVTITGADEVGQLATAFEQMRQSLKARLDELNRLLLVSQGVASSLEISQAIEPVLESALAIGADLARVVLTPAVIPALEGDASQPIRYAVGSAQQLYQDLDEQILNLTRSQDRLVLSNTARPRLFTFTPGARRPESLMAVALRHENQYYGALWVAFDQNHTFAEDEVRFLVTLGGQAALAAANAHLFLNAEIGRQRLASILASTPDPVIVTDQNDRLLLANPAAWQVLDIGNGSLSATETKTVPIAGSKPVDQVLAQPELIELLRSSTADHGSVEKASREIVLPNERVYLATATAVMAEGRRVGRVCILRDVTYFKELDALKSEFVSTVSHDLRSPLTLMRGYATMLEMVGQLNDQQTGYVRKIIAGVENMTHLVNDLLDLGRIEAGVGLAPEMVPIQDVVEKVASALQLQAAQKRIQLTTEIVQPTVPLIEADLALLQQALHNLVENAIKYTRPEGKVHMRVRVQPIGIVFDVMDNGIGISPMDLPRLFEKFYRGAQQGSKDQQGTGLGLAIVKSIAERHGGKVWAESQLGKGSVFHLAIPLSQPQREVVESTGSNGRQQK